MLVLTRKLEESIMIGDDIEIKIIQIKGAGEQATVRIGIEAPRHISVLRKEVYQEVAAENRKASVQVDPALLEEVMRVLERGKSQ